MLLALLVGAGFGLALRSATQDSGVAATGVPATTTPATTTPVRPSPPDTSSENPAPTIPAPTTPPASTSSPSENPPAATDLNVGVVDIDTVLGYEGGRAAGTGMLLTSDGQVLTNHHVVSGATEITVTVVSTGRSYKANVVGTDSSRDVALLQLEDASGLPTVMLGDSSQAAVGDPVTAVGNAGGRGGLPSQVTGEVTALDRDITVSDVTGGDLSELEGLIETSAPLQPGDSGGPLFNASGQVIGMNTAAERSFGRFRSSTSESYAIPIDDAVAIVDTIRTGRETDTIRLGLPAFLGIEVDGSAAAQQSDGVEVAGVLDGTPAEAAGLAAGDVITTFDGQPVSTDDSLLERLHALEPGDTVAVGWTDSRGETRTATVTLATGPVA
jgi:S1-C subfamily serine protease